MEDYILVNVKVNVRLIVDARATVVDGSVESDVAGVRSQ